MSEFIDNLINSSHELILNGQYEEAVNVLKTLKHRIHDETVKQKIKQFEDTHDETLRMRIEDINKSDDNMIEKNRSLGEQWARYSTSYLSFYDGLRKQDGIF